MRSITLNSRFFIQACALFVYLFIGASSQAQSSLKRYPKIEPLGTLNLTAIPETALGIKKQEVHNPHFKHVDGIKPLLQPNSGVNPRSFKRKSIVPEQLSGFKAQTPGGTPLDNNLAISNSGTIISAVNTSIRVYDSTGSILYGRSLAAIANALGTLNRTFDPHVLYDPDEDRFVLVFLNGSDHTNTNLIVGFTQTADPAGDWNFYKVDGNITNNEWWSDYPFIGLTKGHLLISVLLWEDGDSGWDFDARDENIWVINKYDGYAGDSLETYVANDLEVSGKGLWNIRPVKGGDRLYSNILFISNRPKDASNDSIFLIRIDPDLQSNLNITITALQMDKPYGLQPNVSQKDGRRLRTNYCDIHEAYRLENDIFFVANSIDFSTERPGIYVGHLENFEQGLSNTGFIYGVDSLDLCYPSIAYAGAGWPDKSAMVLTLHNSQNAYPGSSAFQLDRQFQPGDLIRLKEGEGEVQVLVGFDSLDRWGDYTGIQRRFNRPGEVWAAGSYGTSNNTTQTWISQLSNNDPQLSIDRSTSFQAQVYPNPGVRHQLDLSLESSANYSFEISDLQGKVCWYKEQELTPGKYSLDLNLSEKPGVYFLRVKNSEGEVFSRKIVHR